MRRRDTYAWFRLRARAASLSVMLLLLIKTAHILTQRPPNQWVRVKWNIHMLRLKRLSMRERSHCALRSSQRIAHAKRTSTQQIAHSVRLRSAMHHKWIDDNVNDDDVAIHEHVQHVRCSISKCATINSFMQKWYRNERPVDRLNRAAHRTRSKCIRWLRGA